MVSSTQIATYPGSSPLFWQETRVQGLHSNVVLTIHYYPSTYTVKKNKQLGYCPYRNFFSSLFSEDLFGWIFGISMTTR